MESAVLLYGMNRAKYIAGFFRYIPVWSLFGLGLSVAPDSLMDRGYGVVLMLTTCSSILWLKAANSSM